MIYYLVLAIEKLKQKGGCLNRLEEILGSHNHESCSEGSSERWVHLIRVMLEELHEVSIEDFELVELCDSSEEDSEVGELAVLSERILLHFLEDFLELRVVVSHFLDVKLRGLADLV